MLCVWIYNFSRWCSHIQLTAKQSDNEAIKHSRSKEEIPFTNAVEPKKLCPKTNKIEQILCYYMNVHATLHTSLARTYLSMFQLVAYNFISYPTIRLAVFFRYINNNKKQQTHVTCHTDTSSFATSFLFSLSLFGNSVSLLYLLVPNHFHL